MFWKLYSRCVVAPERGLLDLLWHWQTHRISQQPVCKTLVHLILFYHFGLHCIVYIFLIVFLVWELHQAKTPHGQTHWMLGEKNSAHPPTFHPMSTLVDGESHRFSGSFSVRGTFSKFTSSKLAPSNDAPVRSDLEKSEPPRSAWRFANRCKSESFIRFFEKKRTGSQNWWMRIFKMIWINLKKQHINDIWYDKQWT